MKPNLPDNTNPGLVTTSFRASEDQRTAWKAIARRHGIGYSDWIRRTLDGAPVPPPPATLTQAQAGTLRGLIDLRHAVLKLGSNINQLTRMAHEGGNVGEPLRPILLHLRIQLDAIEVQLGQVGRRLARAGAQGPETSPESPPEGDD